ncbi:acyl-CoA dehydrogenase [Mycolicibacterium sp. 018/SC-01/001]|uniref:acyl-CoA dehydrogenase family protein n=1 Tax=Mycolicibacterium sp. 018/SC-01/001 TaxID=2592069 RepID=UPI00117DD03B|nr:acyl-CoA dehydrogenase family protein [Mycolicibacterium sp. 018/SC-01/001]TRW76756.1 acyl-CoA dehydrogenase [Mycolicibacterium sp. 018/SC-01/001]
MSEHAVADLGELADLAVELADLRGTADDVLRHAWSADRFRELLDTGGAAYDPQLWRTVCDLGWPDVLVADTAGGGGGTLRQIAVLAEALGAAAAPVPLASAAAAAWCEQRVQDGLTLLIPEPARLRGPRMSGRWPAVRFAGAADRLIVLGVDDDGDAVLAAVALEEEGVELLPEIPLDHTPSATISFVDVTFCELARGTEAMHRHREARLREIVTAVAELVGIADAANAAATDYARVREAFGRPIGAFQAVKHRLVDQRAAVEVGRALVNRAADAVEAEGTHAAPLVSLAAFWAIDSLRSVPEGAMQVFGGIAYTWEHQAHVHLRRAATLAASLGSRSRHRETVTAWLTTR